MPKPPPRSTCSRRMPAPCHARRRARALGRAPRRAARSRGSASRCGNRCPPRRRLGSFAASPVDLERAAVGNAELVAREPGGYIGMRAARRRRDSRAATPRACRAAAPASAFRRSSSGSLSTLKQRMRSASAARDLGFATCPRPRRGCARPRRPRRARARARRRRRCRSPRPGGAGRRAPRGSSSPSPRSRRGGPRPRGPASNSRNAASIAARE